MYENIPGARPERQGVDPELMPGNHAYITDYGGRRLFTVDLADPSAPPAPIAEGVYAYGVALDLPGGRVHVTDVEAEDRAYVGQYDLGGLHEVDLTADGAAEVVVAGGEVKGRQRVAADGLGNVSGIGLDRDNGLIHVSDRQGKLLRTPGVLAGRPGTVVARQGPRGGPDGRAHSVPGRPRGPSPDTRRRSDAVVTAVVRGCERCSPGVRHVPPRFQ
ncbi:hypothetical protein AB0N81_11660 [Streptomyces sp. NPDC093510]|uniref:hypothetical protein n=1 Tax=Streptomyces sp. NPDC093510 TaxID=3155199 RepID=UPI0034340C6A